MQSGLYDRIQAATKDLTSYFVSAPSVAWFAESGLGDLDAHGVRQGLTRDVKDISGFPPNAPGRFVALRFGNAPALAFEGGPLLAEGASAEDVAFPVWVLARAGVKVLCITGGCAALDAAFDAPSIVAIEDHLNFSSLTPFRGQLDERLGPKFPDLANLYDRELMQSAVAAARDVKIPFSTGILAATAGPHFETTAEREFFRRAGAHVVAQSMALPAIAAAHAGMRTLALGLVVESPRQRYEYADPAILIRNAAVVSAATVKLLARWIPAWTGP